MASGSDKKEEHKGVSYQKCTSIKVGGLIVMKDKFPCKVVKNPSSAPGKHGHRKVHFYAVDIFTGKKYDEVIPAHENVPVPELIRKEYPVLSITDDGFLSLLNEETNTTREDLKVPEGEVGEKIRNYNDEGSDIIVTVLAALDQEHVVEVQLDRSGAK
eukprot:TRINITY_DN15012_c0_g1_i1.p1 TRINITY_DN15012_c0_g1~~TRINITY_DN15012_c0_g1_i1.p1  ORF type:complete len:158 (+),score=34.54 TRINITY_DN15012_c0_g1_i1:71-544(+)